MWWFLPHTKLSIVNIQGFCQVEKSFWVEYKKWPQILCSNSSLHSLNLGWSKPQNLLGWNPTLTLIHGSTHLEYDCFPEAFIGSGGASNEGLMVGTGRAGPNYCSGFKVSYRLTNTVLGCRSLFAGGVSATMWSNHFCFQVTFIRPFTAEWDRLLAFQVFRLRSFLHYIPLPRICYFLTDRQWLAQHHKCLVPWPGSAWTSCPTAGAGRGLEKLHFHSCRECGPIRAFKDRGINCLSHSQLPKNLLYPLYKFPGIHVPEDKYSIGPSLPCRLEQYNIQVGECLECLPSL